MKRASTVAVLALSALAVPAVAVAAYSTASVRAQSTSSAAFVPPIAPKTATPAATVTGSGVRLAWDASTLTGGQTPTGYAVFRYVDGSPRTGRTLVTGCTVTVSTRVTCTDGTAAAGTTYVYTTSAEYRSWRGAESTVSAPVTVPAPLTVSSFTLGNRAGGTAGRAEKGDVITVTWSRAIKPSSLSAFFNDSATGAQTVSGNGQVTVHVRQRNTADVLEVSGTTAIAFGTVDLGSTAWVTSDVAFGGNGDGATVMTLSADRTRLTITLGKEGPVNAAPTVSSSVTATYTTNATVTSADGSTSLAGSKTSTGVQF